MSESIYTSFSGSQIVAVTDDDVLDTMQAVSCSVTAEKAPIYVMGKREFHGVTTNKLAAAGSIVAIVDTEDPFAYKLTGNGKKDIYLPNSEKINKITTATGTPAKFGTQAGADISSVRQEAAPRYTFELKPFNLVLIGVDLEGQAIKKVIEQCSIINEGFVTGIDEDHLQMTYAYIAKRTEPWQQIAAAATKK